MSSSMKDIFRQYHRLDDAERSSLWKTCTFALDANVLLNIYRYADSTREDLFRVLEGLGPRVWIPYQAAKEFYRNRIEVITDQRRKYTELQTALDNVLGDLRGGKFRKSAFLRIDDIEAVLKPAIEKARTQIVEQHNEHPDLLQEDVYLERLVSIIGTNLGSELNKECFEKACTAAQTRIEEQRPPGYRDAKKPVPDRYGDVLIWFELLKHAESTKTPITLVTDDDKEDWWQVWEGKKLGPRPELREEMLGLAAVDFYICNPAYFLEKISHQLKVPVSKSSVDDATKVAAENRENLHFNFSRDLVERSGSTRVDTDLIVSATDVNVLSRRAEEAVGRWIGRREPEAIMVRTSGGPFDFLLRTSSNRTIGIEVRVWRHALMGASFMRLRETALRAFYEINRGNIDDFRLFIVATTDDIALHLAERFERRPLEPSYDLSIGLLLPNQEYGELARYPSTQSPDRRQQTSPGSVDDE